MTKHWYNQPRHDKPCVRNLQPGTTQTGPGGDRIWLVQVSITIVYLILKSHRTREILDLARGKSIIDYKSDYRNKNTGKSLSLDVITAVNNGKQPLNPIRVISRKNCINSLAKLPLQSLVWD